MRAVADLPERVAGRSWYHTIDLPGGVRTPGWFDLRPVAPRLPMPARLDGRRCLDVGTFDGFWALEMERRGAVEVLAADILDPLAWDWPHGSSPAIVDALEERKDGAAGFRLIAAVLGSRVRHVERSIYDLNPDDVGHFDFVYVGSLLLHLRDPVLALQRVRAVCRGQALFVDAYDPLLSALFRRRPVAGLDGIGRPWWWLPNLAALRRMVEAAGFALEREPVRVRIPRGAGQPRPLPTPRALRSRDGRRLLAGAWRGDAHAALLCRPS